MNSIGGQMVVHLADLDFVQLLGEGRELQPPARWLGQHSTRAAARQGNKRCKALPHPVSLINLGI